jgi:hypothetical protein
MGDLFRGYTFGATEEVTAAKLHTLVDDGTVTNIVAADFADYTITDDKIQSVGGSKFMNLSAIPSSAGKIPDANISTTTLLELIYPVGIVITLGVSTNPATLLGFGTWEAIAGKVIVGIDGTQTEFDTLDETGGSKSSAHTHTGTTAALTGALHRIDDNSGGSDFDWMNPTSHTHTFTTSSSGSANGNVQPYIVKYVWQRTA